MSRPALSPRAPLAGALALAAAAALVVCSSSVALAVRPASSVAPPPPVTPAGTSLAADPPSAEVTAAPRPDEWKNAPAVRLSHDVDACRAYRVREWLKVHCAAFPAAGVSLLAGPRAGVQLWVDPPRDPGDGMKTLRSAEVIFPVRRGDGRLFQLGQFGEGYDGPVAWNLAFTLSEQWIEGDSAPIVSIR